MAVTKSGEELRSMVRDMKTRSPQEVMGEAATRSLMGSVVTAAVGVIGLLIVSTLGIFLVLGPPAINAKPEAKPIASAVTADEPIADPDAATETGQEDTEQTAPTADDQSDAIEAMEIGETKDPDSATDSLDNRLDDLLQGLE